MSESKYTSRVFLCHAHQDKEIVHKLYERLVRDGIQVWLDVERLSPGQDWEREIRKAILKSNVVIVCLSRGFNKRRGYRHQELKIASEKAKLLSSDEVFIIPVRLEKCDMLESLRHLQRVDLFETGGYKKLIQALQDRTRGKVTLSPGSLAVQSYNFVDRTKPVSRGSAACIRRQSINHIVSLTGRMLMNEFREERKQMVAYQLYARGIKDPRVLKAFEEVPRHIFVPEDALEWAYEDRPLLIGYDQTISQPYIVAYMVQALHLTGTERVLEVGTGSGYQAALLSRLAQEVHTIELIGPLAERAAHALEAVEATNVFIHVGDGSQGWAESAPYDAIIVSAAAQHVPKRLLDQLKSRGRMILPVSVGKYQNLELWTREDDSFSQETLIPVAFVPLRERENM